MYIIPYYSYYIANFRCSQKYAVYKSQINGKGKTKINPYSKFKESYKDKKKQVKKSDEQGINNSKSNNFVGFPIFLPCVTNEYNILL